MRILALQLKRIGDLILTTPALRLIRECVPDPHVVLAMDHACADLAPAIPGVDSFIIFGRGRGFTPWQQAITSHFDVCLDFTGSDRSALVTALSRAPRRLTFEWVRKSRARSLAYTEFVTSRVRDWHTTDHYLHLLAGLDLHFKGTSLPIVKRADPLPEISTAGPIQTPAFLPGLNVPPSVSERAIAKISAAGVTAPYAVVHPGTARPEKYWEPERWAAVITHLRERHGMECVLTGGADAFELRHIESIQQGLLQPCRSVAGKLDLLEFAAVIERARLCISCDTAAVHLAAAFETPQIALYGPTNPFHWRPRHAQAVVLSAAHPEQPLRDFDPRIKGAPMAGISTDVVLRATDALLAL